MKKFGLILLVIGLTITLFSGLKFMTREKVVDIGSLEIMTNKSHTLDWSPYLGLGVMAIGFISYLLGNKNK